MSGGETWDTRGIIPRTYNMLFRKIYQMERENPDFKHTLYISYFEIYNETSYDLLDKKHAELPFEKWSKINMYEDLNNNFHLRNLTVHQCNNEQTALDLLIMGNHIRQVSSTPMNLASSRSHCILTI
jgi:kinesin family protein 6/9